MNKEWLDKWNDRYRNEVYAFGETPNEFLKTQLEKLNAGTILFPAEGEGRNAMFAAMLGWKAHAFDISIEGKRKAIRLAKRNGVAIDYKIGELPDLNYQSEQFDAIALIYAHFPAEIKSRYHRLLSSYLRNGGIVLFEAFSKSHLKYVVENPGVGGPRDIGSLFSIDELKSDFLGYEIIELAEKEIELNEGLHHVGRGAVIRFVGIKK